MSLEFAHSWVLIIWPILIALTILAGHKSRRSRSRRIGETILRCLVFTTIILALAGPSIGRESDVTTTVFLVDMSDSMKGQWNQEIEFVKNSIADMPQKNQAGVVVFGEDAQIEQFVSDKKIFTDVQSEVLAGATNLQQAVSTAIALFPDDTAKRLVLLTDGAENQGNLADIALSVAASEVEIKVVSYDNTIAQEVYVSDVTMPDTISEGDQFQVKVEIYASEATDATVSLYSGRTLKGQKQVTLQKGDNQLIFSDQGVETGIKNYRVTVEAAKDTVTVNNTYSAFTTVKSQAKLLVIEGSNQEASEFCKLLDACNYDYDLMTPAGVPTSISDMLMYQSVVMVDVYADDLRNGFMDTLETYVKDYAGGLAVLGGPNSYALGNYRDTKLEELLPVNVDLDGEKKIPSIAMVMVIDHSGSMSSSSTERGSITCLDVAKNAACSALEALRDIDQVGVVAFDDKYDWAVPIQSAANANSVEEKISSIPLGGGTSIYPAIREAADRIKESDATIKHIVLLTDGQDYFREYDDLEEDLRENGITLSTVAIGAEADTKMLNDLANACNGRYYYSDAGQSLPRIFAQEVFLSTESYLINEEFVPTITNSHEIISNVFDQGSPSLLGYIASSSKDTATVILESHREDPVLAAWQCGLGRAVAWTSDGTNQWTGNFAGWENYVTLWRNIIDWTIYQDTVDGDSVAVAQKASSAVISYTTKEYDARTSLSAIITGEDGKQKEVELIAKKPGCFEAEVPLSETGVYSINVRKSQDDQVVSSTNTATAMQYSQEYRYAEASNSVAAFLSQVNGREIQETSQVFDTQLKGNMARRNMTSLLLVLGAILFVIDIICRRLRVDWIYSVQSLFKRLNAPKAVPKDTLAETKIKRKNPEKKDYKVAKDTPKETSSKKKEKTRKRAKNSNPEPTVIDTSALLKKKEDRNL